MRSRLAPAPCAATPPGARARPFPRPRVAFGAVRTRPPAAPARCSVVVPVRDDEAELRGLLESLAQQQEPPAEIIVVDNGSSDASAAVARAAGCVVIAHPVPSIAAASAAGYDAARGELIVRCDADSRPPPGWLRAHQRAHAQGGPRTVLVTGPGRFRLPAPLGGLLSGLYMGTYLLLTAAALGHFPAFGTTMSMRRDWWHQVCEETSRSADVHDDMDLSFRVRPGQRVRVTGAVAVEMSPRALRAGSGLLLRWRRAVHTLRRNWRLERPWQRWAARIAWRGGTR
ncbi:glycosyltransferase family 2 protein [Brachybacterium sp. Z12]|nr:glycosyltransferase family 2 protein [Brachybacterium sp. Z12]